VYLSAYPSLARKVNDKLSLGASQALTYTSYEQIKAEPNVDPGLGDGRLQIEADGTTVGFVLSRFTNSATEHDSDSSIGRSWMRYSGSQRDSQLHSDWRRTRDVSVDTGYWLRHRKIYRPRYDFS